MSTASAVRVGQQLGPYRIEGLLGSGGMAQVFLALDTRLLRAVAIKIPSGAPQMNEALWQEARLAAALNHPAICTVHEIGHAGDAPYLVMEYVKGTPLSIWIETRGPLPSEVAISYASQVADALSHAHTRGIVHGDIKSSNVMVEPDGRVKVLDFGVAVRSGTAPDVASEADTTTPTPSNGGAGTVPYMAPELLRGRVPDVKSDIWALGVLFYEMLTGFRPFRGVSPYETAAHILTNERETATPRIPRELSRVIDCCLSAEPCDRFASAREFVSALEDVEWQARQDDDGKIGRPGRLSGW